MANKLLAEVAPAIPFASASAAAVYTYSVSHRDHKRIAIGSQVSVPLGKQRVVGTVLRLHSHAVPYPTKTLTLIPQPSLTPQQLEFARWISITMRGSLGFTLRLFFVPKSSSSPTVPHPHLLPPPAGGQGEGDTTPRLVIEKNDAQRWHSVQKFLQPLQKTKTQALILIPEVRLAASLQTYLARSFPHVVVYHSETTPAEAAAVWRDIYEGQPRIIIGTQKALYLPWRTLSHSIVEEEYIDTHKLWDAYPRLDNRDAVRELAALHASQLLYSGSWPSLARQYDLLQKRVLPLRHSPVAAKPKILPLSFEERGQGHLLPGDALSHIQEGVRQGERTLILYNQRGSWRTALCTACHQALRCPECQSTVFVTGTKAHEKIQCRQCTYTAPLPHVCPHCQSKKIKVFGPGTAKMASILHAVAPRAAVVEITAQSRVTPDQLAHADIVLGTTALWRATTDMSFDRALWLFPETTLLYPDYRSSERAAGLLARLQKMIPSRRRVLVVTRYLDLVQNSLGLPAEKFTTQLLRERARLNYPPYADMIKLSCYGRSEAAALAAGRSVREALDAALTHRLSSEQAEPVQKPPLITIRGPYQGFNKKDGKHFVAHLLLTGPLPDLIPLYHDVPINRAELSPAQIL